MKELLIQWELDKADEDLVRMATAVVDRTGIAGKDQRGQDIMEPKQIRNVIAVADETQSLSVVDNFIKYQIGRRDEWRHNDFGEAVRKDLEALAKRAESLEDKRLVTKELEIHLVRRYLGYLVRHFTYKQKAGGQ